MARKLKASPRSWLTASNLLIAHVAFHILFVFGYWLSVAASLSFSDPNFIENHLLAFLSNASSNHLALLVVLGIHMLVVVAIKWWKQRQQGAVNRQSDSELGHLTGEEKLELLLDEVAELREGLHQRDVDNRTRNPELASARLRDRSPVALDSMIGLEDDAVVKAGSGS